MEIELSEEFERFVDDQLQTGRFSTKEEFVKEALQHFKRVTTPARSPLFGLFADEPDLMDAIVEQAMKDRKTRSLRLPENA